MLTALERLRELREEAVANREAGIPELEAIPAIIADLPEPPEWDQAVSDVLGLLVRSEAPLPHSALMKALQEKGHTQRTARGAIAKVQELGWIGHNLTTGYELP